MNHRGTKQSRGTSEMFTHRPVQEADISLIRQFPQSESELFFMHPKGSYPLTCDQLKKAIRERIDSTVALADNNVAGFANFIICEPREKCVIGNVIVLPQWRRQGVGHYLVETMTLMAFEKHQVQEVHIPCFNQNVPGLLLYPKLGFRPFKIEEWSDKQGNRVALIHMKLPRTDGEKVPILR